MMQHSIKSMNNHLIMYCSSNRLGFNENDGTTYLKTLEKSLCNRYDLKYMLHLQSLVDYTALVAYTSMEEEQNKL